MNRRIWTVGTATTMRSGCGGKFRACSSPIAPRSICCRILISIFVISISLASCAAAQLPVDESPDQDKLFSQYGPYELPLPEIANVKLLFKTDIDLVTPIYQDYSRSDPELLQYLSSGSEETASRFRPVLDDTGWGHIVPYLYAAIHSFLGRVYYGKSSNPVLADGIELLPKQKLESGIITIRAITDPSTWNTYLARLGHAGAGAYWDAINGEVGILVDKTMLLGAVSQANWTGRTRLHNIASLESYISRLVLRDFGHELFHAIQQRTRANIYKSPLLAEGTALYAQHNVLQREEFVTLSQAQTQIASHYQIDEASMGDCLDSFDSSSIWIGDYFSVGRFHSAHRYIRERPTFSLTSLMQSTPSDFYATPSRERDIHYAIGLTAIYYLLHASSGSVEAWRNMVDAMSNPAGPGVSERDALLIDTGYRNFIDGLAEKWWDHPDAEERHVLARTGHTKCLNALQVMRAWFGAVASAAYLPENPTSPLYLGDIFWRIQNFGDAFEYYKAANAMARSNLHGEYPSRLLSRLADAAMELGDIQLAIELYKQVSELPLEHPSLFQVFTRSRLKYEYYQLHANEEDWLSEASRLRLNAYVDQLQSPQIRQQSGMLASQQNWQEFIRLLSEQYNRVLARMQEEQASTGH